MNNQTLKQNIINEFKELMFNDYDVGLFGMTLENAYKEIKKIKSINPDLLKEVFKELKKSQEQEEKEYGAYKEKEELSNLEESIKYKISLFLKTIRKDYREFIKCNDICLSGDKDFIHLYFMNIKTNRKLRKFIEIDKRFIPFLYSYEKEKTYSILDKIIDNIIK